MFHIVGGGVTLESVGIVMSRNSYDLV